MKKTYLFFLSFLLFIFSAFLFLEFYESALTPRLYFNLSQIEQGRDSLVLKEAQKEISTPPPLRLEERYSDSFLEREGIIEWTNVYRQEHGLFPLKESKELNESAIIKASDMVSNQYFAHISPLGVGVGDVVESVGYDFIVVGENLAVGNFQNDKSLVQGWMESPGHRENILNKRYEEMGAAVIQGEYEGARTWFAVQHFATPLSSCQEPDESLKNQIDLNQEEIEKLYSSLEVLREKIENERPKYGRDYNQKIDQYNDFVFQYNKLIEGTRILINRYNNQVDVFNDCVAGED